MLSAPRTDPSERNYRAGLLPWVMLARANLGQSCSRTMNVGGRVPRSLAPPPLRLGLAHDGPVVLPSPRLSPDQARSLRMWVGVAVLTGPGALALAAGIGTGNWPMVALAYAFVPIWALAFAWAAPHIFEAYARRFPPTGPPTKPA